MVAARDSRSIEDLPSYSRTLLAVRKQRDWSQAQLALELCVNVRTVQRWENGQQEPHPGWTRMFRELLAQEKVI